MPGKTIFYMLDASSSTASKYFGSKLDTLFAPYLSSSALASAALIFFCCTFAARILAMSSAVAFGEGFAVLVEDVFTVSPSPASTLPC